MKVPFCGFSEVCDKNNKGGKNWYTNSNNELSRSSPEPFPKRQNQSSFNSSSAVNHTLHVCRGFVFGNPLLSLEECLFLLRFYDPLFVCYTSQWHVCSHRGKYITKIFTLNRCCSHLNLEWECVFRVIAWDLGIKQLFEYRTLFCGQYVSTTYKWISRKIKQ